MKRSHKQSLRKTFAFAATFAVLGASVGIPVEPAFAAQRPVAHENAAPRARPVELAFSLIEHPGQRQGMGDGSVKSGRKGARGAQRGIGVIAPSGDGGKQGMGDGSVKAGRKGSRGAQSGIIGVLKPGGAGGAQGMGDGSHTGGVQLPAVQR